MAQVLLSMRATSNPGDIRSASGMLVAPERRMSSCVITVTADGDNPTVLSRRETDVTSMFISSTSINSSRLIFLYGLAALSPATCCDVGAASPSTGSAVNPTATPTVATSPHRRLFELSNVMMGDPFSPNQTE
jgi:hypothetical protein